jgi:hypothetical protein
MAEIKLPPTVTPVIGPTANNKSFELFQSANEVVPLAASDKTSVEALQKHLGASIGTASVVAGVL